MGSKTTQKFCCWDPLDNTMTWLMIQLILLTDYSINRNEKLLFGIFEVYVVIFTIMYPLFYHRLIIKWCWSRKFFKATIIALAFHLEQMVWC